MTLRLTTLEARENPVVVFDASVPVFYRPGIEAGVLSVTTHVTRAPDVTVKMESLAVRNDARVAETRDIGTPTPVIVIDPVRLFHGGATPVGLDPYEIDLYSVVAHETMHALGRIPHEPDAPQLLTFPVGFGSVLQPTVLYGHRYEFTDRDAEILTGLGYAVVNVPTVTYVSIADGWGICHLIAIDKNGIREVATTGTTHVVIADYDHDGLPDVRVVPSRTGIDVVYYGTGAIEAVPTAGVAATQVRY